jgi:hypothetical protein
MALSNHQPEPGRPASYALHLVLLFACDWNALGGLGPRPPRLGALVAVPSATGNAKLLDLY